MDGNDCDVEMFFAGNGGMGEAYEHRIEQSVSCPCCGNEIFFRISGYEYPAGAYDYDDYEIDGGEFLKEPKMGMFYYREDFDPSMAYYECDRIQRIICDAAINQETLYNIKPREFEELVEQIFRDNGFETILTPQSKDGGKDIIAVKHEMGKPIVFYIECKRYRRKAVNINIVRELYGVQTADLVNKSILVTTGHITAGAREFIDERRNMMSVIDIDELTELLRASARKYEIEYQEKYFQE